MISPAALSAIAPDPDRSPGQLSAMWLLALAARTVQEVGELIGRAKRARRRLATFGMDTEIHFASASDRSAFAAELSDAVETLVSNYHHAFAPGGRRHRLLAAIHPSITRPAAEQDNPISPEGDQRVRVQPRGNPADEVWEAVSAPAG